MSLLFKKKKKVNSNSAGFCSAGLTRAFKMLVGIVNIQGQMKVRCFPQTLLDRIFFSFLQSII